MADQQHVYDVTIDGVDYEVNSPVALSDAQAYQAAKAQHAVPSAAERLTTLRTANKQPLPRVPTLGDEFTLDKMGKRALLGAKGEVEGAVGGLVAPAVMLYHAVTSPVESAKAVGKGALMLGGLAYQSAQHPREALDGAVEAAKQFGLSPEAIGAAAGGTGAALAMPTIIGAARGTRLGQAVATGVSDAANRIPGVKAARAAYAGPTVIAPKAVKPVKVPPTLSEQLGVSPNATGAVMDSLPETPVPAPARMPVMLAHDAARTEAAASAARESADALGVSGARPPLVDGPVLEHPAAMPRAAEPGVRERIPVPVRPSANPAAVTEGAQASSFDDLARELGLDPSKLRRETPAEIYDRSTSEGGRFATNNEPVPLPGVKGATPPAPAAAAAGPDQRAVADAYDAMAHAPHDPKVRVAYDALREEIGAQFKQLTDGGLKVEPWTGEGQPYKTSAAMSADVADNQHLYYYPTEKGFGSAAVANHPLLELSPSGSGLPSNDELRIVHDVLAHAGPGNSFSAKGEYSAFLEHLKTLSPEARKALASETHGQNSWVNFGKHLRNDAGELLTKGEEGYIAPPDRPFAPQKAGLLPEELVPELTGVSAPEGAPAPETDTTGLTREELAKELMARFAQRNDGVAATGTRKRGSAYDGHKD